MHISNVRVQKRKGTVKVSAEIKLRQENAQTMYFIVPRAFESFIAADATVFFAALLLPCMKQKESISIDGGMSQKLLSNTKKIMKLCDEWQIGLSPIGVDSVTTTKDAFTPEYAACFFSAGVDSFSTFLKNKELFLKNKISQKQKITHFILVHGFDIELKNKPLFNAAKKNIEKICEQEGITLITIETNLRSIIEPKLIWDFSHGGALASVALLLRRQFHTVYIAGAVRRDEVFPYGTHPLLDPLWGTETLRIVHDGTEYNRLKKVKRYIAPSQTVRTYLRVCNQNRKDEYNCGKCFKCLKTMLELACFEVLDSSPSFPESLDLERVRSMHFDYDLKYHYQAIAILEALQKVPNTEELQNALKESLEKSKHKSMIQKIVKLGAKVDQKYFNRRIFSYLFAYQNQDRRFLFKICAQMGMIK